MLCTIKVMLDKTTSEKKMSFYRGKEDMEKLNIWKQVDKVCKEW